jgi:RNA-directed DNA polymerase
MVDDSCLFAHTFVTKTTQNIGPIVSAILSKFLSLLESDDARKNILRSITKRFDKIPNTGHIQLWLQRVVLKIDRERTFAETLCQKVNDPTIPIWNSDWLNIDFRTMIESQAIINEEIIEEIDEIIDAEEVQFFEAKSSY